MNLPQEIRDYLIENAGSPVEHILAHPFYHVVGIDHLVLAGIISRDDIKDSVAKNRDEYENLCSKSEFEAALYCVHKAYRAEYLLALIEANGVEALYPAIGSVWISVENIDRDYDLWQDIWSAVVGETGNNLAIMDDEDQAEYAALADTITIYRGFRSKGGEYGWSWTLDRKIAEWFAYRFTGVPMIATATIPKVAALAYFGGRSESEIVVQPDQFSEITIEKIAQKKYAAAA
jgi:hypothetical protein